MIFQFTAPPLPHYIICGEDTYQVGDKHPDRYNIGVFDLILVTKGRFSWRRTVPLQGEGRMLLDSKTGCPPDI